MCLPLSNRFSLSSAASYYTKCLFTNSFACALNDIERSIENQHSDIGITREDRKIFSGIINAYSTYGSFERGLFNLLRDVSKVYCECFQKYTRTMPVHPRVAFWAIKPKQTNKQQANKTITKQINK